IFSQEKNSPSSAEVPDSISTPSCMNLPSLLFLRILLFDKHLKPIQQKSSLNSSKKRTRSVLQRLINTIVHDSFVLLRLQKCTDMFRNKRNNLLRTKFCTVLCI